MSTCVWRLVGRKWIIRLLLAVVIATACAVTAYYQAPTILAVDSGPAKAGAIVVLGGDPLGRPARVAELFADGAAPLVIVSGDGDFARVVQTLQTHGVPTTAIRVEGRSRNTLENATLSVTMLRNAGISNAIIVTSWFHSRRALNCFRKAAPEMGFYSRPSYYGLDRSAWSRNGVGDHIRAEYLKLLGYWLRYGISPF